MPKFFVTRAMGDGIFEVTLDYEPIVSMVFGPQILFVHPLGWFRSGCGGVRAIGRLFPVSGDMTIFSSFVGFS